MCPELASPLGHIRNALGQALYSNYYAAADGTLDLRQLPYFTVVERLELEKTNLQQKYEESKNTTAAHEARHAGHVPRGRTALFVLLHSRHALPLRREACCATI